MATEASVSFRLAVTDVVKKMAADVADIVAKRIVGEYLWLPVAWRKLTTKRPRRLIWSEAHWPDDDQAKTLCGRRIPRSAVHVSRARFAVCEVCACERAKRAEMERALTGREEDVRD